MAGAAMNRITTPSMSKLRISPPAKELCWECLLSSQGWPQQFKECLTPLSCWLTGPDGVPATRPYGALACAPLVWRPQIAFSLYEFGLLALRPGVIGQRELHAIRDGWMRIKQKDSHGIGLRIRQVHVAKDLKRLGRHVVRIRRESVGDLEAILVGLMFIVAAARAGDGVRGERKDGEEQQQGRQRRPVLEAANFPIRAPASKHPADAAMAEIEEHEQERGAKSEQFGDMPQDVMAHLMTGDVNDLWGGHLGDGGIKHDDAFRGSETSHVGVQRRGLLGRTHPEHPLRRDVFSGPLHHPFKAGRERGILLLERLEFEKQRSNDERLHEKQEEANRQRNEPKIKPPAARGFAD